MNEKEVKNQWHQGFYGAMELELREDAHNLTFEMERNLGKEPLRMDMLVIKKSKDLPIANEIGHIFRKHNVIEYKSPRDGLSIDDYVKTVGYACIYKSLANTTDEIPVEDITITIVRDIFPGEMIKTLNSLGNKVEEVTKGIYYVSGNTMFLTQIVVTSQLTEEHTWLRVLTDRIEEQDVINFSREGKKLTTQGEKYNIDAIYQVSVKANRKFYEELKRRDKDMCEALMELMKPELEEEYKDGFNNGFSDGKIKQLAESIRNLMDSLKYSYDEACDVLKVEDKEKYRNLI